MTPHQGVISRPDAGASADRGAPVGRVGAAGAGLLWWLTHSFCSYRHVRPLYPGAGQMQLQVEVRLQCASKCRCRSKWGCRTRCRCRPISFGRLTHSPKASCSFVRALYAGASAGRGACASRGASACAGLFWFADTPTHLVRPTTPDRASYPGAASVQAQVEWQVQIEKQAPPPTGARAPKGSARQCAGGGPRCKSRCRCRCMLVFVGLHTTHLAHDALLGRHDAPSGRHTQVQPRCRLKCTRRPDAGVRV